MKAARILTAIFMIAGAGAFASAAEPETYVGVVEGTPRSGDDGRAGSSFDGSRPDTAAEPSARGASDRTSGAERDDSATRRRRSEKSFPWAILFLLVVVGGAAASS